MQSNTNDQQIGGNHYKNKNIQTWDYILENNIGYMVCESLEG